MKRFLFLAVISLAIATLFFFGKDRKSQREFDRKSTNSLFVMGLASPATASEIKTEVRRDKGEVRVEKVVVQRGKGPSCPCSCGCGETGICTCGKLSFNMGVEKARQEGKSLVVWVGLFCPSKEKEFSNVIHAHENEIPSNFGIKRDLPYVIVGKYQGGAFVDWRGFGYIPSLSEVQSVISVKKETSLPEQNQEYSSEEQNVYSPPRPLFRFAPMRSFGGGC